MNLRYLVAALVLVTTFAASERRAFAQCGSPQKTLSELQADSPDDFMLSLDQFLKYRLAGDWPRVYERSIYSVRQDVDKEKFIITQTRAAKAESRRLAKFFPTSAVVVNMYRESKIWLIEGCGYYKQGRVKTCLRSGTSAMLHNGKWYFDDLNVLVDAVGGSEQQCRR